VAYAKAIAAALQAVAALVFASLSNPGSPPPGDGYTSLWTYA